MLPAKQTKADKELLDEVNALPEIVEAEQQHSQLKDRVAQTGQVRVDTYNELEARRKLSTDVSRAKSNVQETRDSLQAVKNRISAIEELLSRVGNYSELHATIDNTVSIIQNGDFQHRFNPEDGAPTNPAPQTDDGDIDMRIEAMNELHSQLSARTGELLKEAEVETERHNTACDTMLVTLEDEWVKEIQFLTELRDQQVTISKEHAFHLRRGTHVKEASKSTTEADLEREKYRYNLKTVEYQNVEARISDVKGEIQKYRNELTHLRKSHNEEKKDKEKEFQEKLTTCAALRSELKDLQQEHQAIRLLRGDILNISADVKRATEGRL